MKAPKIVLLQEWLATQELKRAQSPGESFKVLIHCTEKTNVSDSTIQWQAVFKKLGHHLEVVNVGCCGMAGTFGHETAHKAMSEGIYNLSWRETIEKEHAVTLLATGFSCRSQAKRFSNARLLHPIQVLKVTANS